MKTLTRKEVSDMAEHYRVVLETESYHDHELVEDEIGRPKWRENPETWVMVEEIGLTNVSKVLNQLGYGKETEVMKKLFRDMGYLLEGYYELFYWDSSGKRIDNHEKGIDG